MKYFFIAILLTGFVNANGQESVYGPKGDIYKVFENNKTALLSAKDFTNIEILGEKLVPRNKVFTYAEAIKVRLALESYVKQYPEALPVRWAMMRYYLSASNFTGGSNEKALEQARMMYGLSKYIGCLAYEFSFTRMQKFDKAELWYKRSIYLNQTANNIEWKDIAYNKPVLKDARVSGNFNNWIASKMYENYDGNYSRKVLSEKGKAVEYVVSVDNVRKFNMNK
ncbi:MAG: hypothetical protein ACOVNR_02410 [Chitinophagaceae bacterium]